MTRPDVQEANDGTFADPPLAEAVPPEGLLDGVMGALAREGLVAPLGAEAASPPPGLHASTMARLEREGLVRPEAGARVLAAPRAGLPWRGAAAALLALGAGVAIGYLARGERIVVREVARDVVRDRPVEVVREVPVVREVVREVIVDRPVERVVTVEKVVERPVERIVERIVEVPAPSGPSSAGAPDLVVASARGLERWDGAVGAWRVVSAGARLTPGALLRGTRAESAVVFAGPAPSPGATATAAATAPRLEAGLLVLGPGGALEPVPEGIALLAAADAPARAEPPSRAPGVAPPRAPSPGAGAAFLATIARLANGGRGGREQ